MTSGRRMRGSFRVDAGGVRRLAACVASGVALHVGMARAADAQTISDSLVLRALDLEANGQPRHAAPLYRRGLQGTDAVTALLGLERVYAELGMTDSLLAPLDSIVRRMPRDATVRAVQLRTYQTLRRRDELIAAAAAWAALAPRDAEPYRELIRALLAVGRPADADSVLRRAERALDDVAPLAPEIAQLRAGRGDWRGAAQAWRLALTTDHWLADAAAHMLAAAPAGERESIRTALLHAPTVPAARLALASLESQWGSPDLGWRALADLAPDSATVSAWLAFGDRAEAEGRWELARGAYDAALRWRDDAGVRRRAAHAAMESGDAAGALALAPMPPNPDDSAAVAATLVPLHVRALSRLGRAEEAAALLAGFDRFIPPGPRIGLARAIAMGWVRRGDLARARAALHAAGDGADSSSAAGWIALFDGDAVSARALLAGGEERTAEVALALAVLARHREARTPEIGAAFLALVRGDSADAATRFAAAGAIAPAAASLLDLTAARLFLAGGDTAAAVRGWEGIIARHAASPEAAEALLSVARVDARRGNASRAGERLEELILSHPASALVPAARRELELLRRTDTPSR